MIYLASPYENANPVIRDGRYRAVSRVAYELIQSGNIVFSPIAYSIPMVSMYGDINLDIWLGLDKAILLRCEKVIVLMLSGWEKSKGILMEIEWAEEAGIPVEYMD